MLNQSIEWFKNNPKKQKVHRKEWRENNPEYNKQYYENNSERIKKNSKQYRENNPGKVREIQKRYCINNPEKVKKYSKQWHLKNKEYINRCRNNRRKIDIKFNINHKISMAINKSLRKNKNGWHWEDLVGYTLNDLIKRLKKTMPKGYTWDDYLKGKLHIDHIIPSSAHNFTKPEHPDFKKCWALSNLQLLPAKENLVKNSKLLRPFQPALRLC